MTTSTDRDLAALLAADLMTDCVARLALADLLTDEGRADWATALRAGEVPLSLPGWGRRAYFVHYPRNFANEYTVYVVRLRDAARLEAVRPGAQRIDAADAWRRGVTRRAEARRDGEQWFGGLAGPGDSADWRLKGAARRASALASAEAATYEEIAEAELMAEASAEYDEMLKSGDY